MQQLDVHAIAECSSLQGMSEIVCEGGFAAARPEVLVSPDAQLRSSGVRAAER